MAIDFFEKEVERLTIRFNKVFGDQVIFDHQARYASILAICRAGMLIKSIRNISDEKQISALTREFCRIRKGLNRFFDHMESQSGRRMNEHTKDKYHAAAGG